MSNELYNTIARVTDGIYEGIYISILLCPCVNFKFFVLLFHIISMNFEISQVSPLEEMFFLDQLYLIMC